MAGWAQLWARMHRPRATHHPWTSKLDSYILLKETLGLRGLLTKAVSSTAGATPAVVPPWTPWDPAASSAWPLSASLQERTEGETIYLNFCIWILAKWKPINTYLLVVRKLPSTYPFKKISQRARRPSCAPQGPLSATEASSASPALKADGLLCLPARARPTAWGRTHPRAAPGSRATGAHACAHVPPEVRPPFPRLTEARGQHGQRTQSSSEGPTLAACK